VVVVIVVLVAVVMLATVAGVLVTRLRQPVAEPPLRRSTITAAAPFTGLESALDQVTGRDGRKLRDKIEGETAIDDLRVVDDSGPILRRALDHVEQSYENTHVDHGRVDAGDLPPVAKSDPPVTPVPPDQSPA
jgi:hypothetical protein